MPTPIDPSQSSDSYLDLMVIFLRDVIDALEVESLREVDFDHVVPLTQGRVDRKTGAFISRIDLPTWNAAIGPGGPGYVVTDLSHNEFTSAVLRVRLRGFAVSCAAPSPEAAYSHLKRFAAVIFPPDAPDLFSPGAVRERNPIVVEDIRITEPGNIRAIVYDSITNIDPRGVWRIQVSSGSFYPDPQQRKRATDGVSSISDLRLHLRLRAVLAKDAGSWADFAW
ncbi:MAG: hypothetical protein ACLP4V_17025 [Methylocella sp.]